MEFLCCKVFFLAHTARQLLPPKYFVPIFSNIGEVSQKSQKAGGAYIQATAF